MTSEQERRVLLERELEERLARDTAPGTPLEAVALVCLKCRGTCTSDAHFCKYCGTRFNVLIVARVEKAGGSA